MILFKITSQCPPDTKTDWSHIRKIKYDCLSSKNGKRNYNFKIQNTRNQKIFLNFFVEIPGIIQAVLGTFLAEDIAYFNV